MAMSKENKENSIMSAVAEICKAVDENGSYAILFLSNIPNHNRRKISIIGKKENQAKIANMLKKHGIEAKKMAEGYYIFFLEGITEEEKKEAEKEAIAFGHWYGIID